MKNFFIEDGDGFYLWDTSKFQLNSISICYEVMLTQLNATSFNIFQVSLENYLKAKLNETLIIFYTQVIKKEKNLLIVVYYQYPRQLDSNKELINSIISSIKEIEISKLITEDNISDLKSKALNKLNATEKDYKTFATKKCLEVLDEDYVSIYGDKKSLSELDYNYFSHDSEWFIKRCSHIYLSGNFDKEVINTFKEISYNFRPIKPRSSSKSSLSKHQHIKLATKKLPYSTVIIALQLDTEHSFGEETLNIFNDYLGGGGYSLLFNSIREKKQLVYSIDSNVNINKGEFIITAKTSHEKLNDVLRMIDLELSKFEAGYINEKIYTATIQSRELQSKKLLDRPLSLVRSHLNLLLTNQPSLEHKKEDFKILLKDLKKVITVTYTEVKSEN